MLGVDKMIARIEVPVVFNDRKIPAGAPKDTQRMVLSVCRSCGLLEYLYHDPPYVLPHPLIKDGAEKDAKRISWHRSGAHAPFGGWSQLNQRNEAEVLGFDLLEKAVNLKRMLDIFRMDNAEDINRNFVLPQEAISLHHLLVSRLLALGHAITVVQGLWTVQAEADCKTFRCEEAAPFLIEDHAVRLYAVGDAPVLGAELSLQFGNLSKVIQAEKGRFPSVPEETDYWFWGNFYLLDDVLFQEVAVHMERLGLGIELFLLEVVAIVAVKVASCSCRFDKDLKFT